MNSRCVSLFFILSAILAFTSAYQITIAPRAQECFFEELTLKQKLLCTYSVTSGGMLDINVRVTGPDGKVVYEQDRDKEGGFQFFAQAVGSHQVCFSNSMSTMTSKVLSFNIYTGHELHRVQNAKNSAIDPLEKSASTLLDNTRRLTDSYDYLRTRSMLAQSTIEDSLSLVWWFGLVNVLLVLVGLYLRTAFIVHPFESSTNSRGGSQGLAPASTPQYNQFQTGRPFQFQY